MNSIRKSSKLVMWIFVLMIFGFGCKSKKKAMEAAAAEKARQATLQARMPNPLRDSIDPADGTRHMAASEAAACQQSAECMAGKTPEAQAQVQQLQTFNPLWFLNNNR